MINRDHPRYAAALEFLHEAAATRASGAIALTGPAGTGASAVLAAFAAQETGTVTVNALPGLARLTPYGAAARLHGALTGRRDSLDSIQALASRIPEFGSMLAELDQVLIAGINTGVCPIDELAPYADAAARAIANAIADAAKRGGVRVLAADQIGWWDPTSRRVLAHLAAAAPEAGLLIAATDTSERTDAAAWIDQVIGERAEARHTLPGLDDTEIHALATELGFALAPGAAEGIAQTTGGHPLVVDLHLRHLARAGHRERPVPAAVAEAVRAAFAPLPKTERRILTAAAVQGHRFDLATVAALHRGTEATVRAVLEQTAQSTGFFTGGPVGGTIGYLWRHETIRDTVLELADPGARRALHSRASQALIAAAGGRQMPLESWIDICLHERASGPAASLGAAGSLVHATEVAYLALGFDECDQIAALAQEAAEAASGPVPQRGLHRAMAISYRLLAADRPGHADPSGDDALAAAGEDAAATSDRVDYRARAALARSRTLQRTAGLDAQIRKLQEAHQFASGAGDPDLARAAAALYGRQWAKRDLAAARKLLAETEAAWEGVELTFEQSLWFNLCQMYAGVLSFDAGDFDAARGRLSSACIQAEFSHPVQLAPAANFAAQLHFATGDVDEGIRALTSALDTDTEHGVTSAWTAYNRALLAEHQARTGIAGAPVLARRAWSEILASGHPNLTSLVGLQCPTGLSDEIVDGCVELVERVRQGRAFY